MRKIKKYIIALFRTLHAIINHPLNKTRKLQAIGCFIKWQVGSRLVPGEVIYHWIENTKFIVSPGEFSLTLNIYFGLHEFNEMSYVLHVLRDEDLFIDVGANVGSYTILACGARRARGYCFEPVPETFLRLEENLKLNNLLNRVEAQNLGLADIEGELFFTSNKNTGNHIINNNAEHPCAIKVKVMPLDAILKDESPSMIKIDVEGFETLVIAGASQTLKKPSLRSVIMEINGSGAKHGFREEKLLDTMQSFGFRSYAYDPFKRNLIPLTGRNNESGNIIFCRNEVFIQKRLANAPKFHVNGLEL